MKKRIGLLMGLAGVVMILTIVFTGAALAAGPNGQGDCSQDRLKLQDRTCDCDADCVQDQLRLRDRSCDQYQDQVKADNQTYSGDSIRQQLRLKTQTC